MMTITISKDQADALRQSLTLARDQWRQNVIALVPMRDNRGAQRLADDYLQMAHDADVLLTQLRTIGA